MLSLSLCVLTDLKLDDEFALFPLTTNNGGTNIDSRQRPTTPTRHQAFFPPEEGSR
jgi:hypothetical protein